MLGILLDRVIHTGLVTVVFSNGVRRTWGRGAPHVAVKLRDRRAAAEPGEPRRTALHAF